MALAAAIGGQPLRNRVRSGTSASQPAITTALIVSTISATRNGIRLIGGASIFSRCAQHAADERGTRWFFPNKRSGSWLRSRSVDGCNFTFDDGRKRAVEPSHSSRLRWHELSAYEVSLMSVARSRSWFTRFAQATARMTGRPAAFATAATVVVLWGVSGPLFGFSDTWQLVINTGTTIVTFLMVFLIQNTPEPGFGGHPDQAGRAHPGDRGRAHGAAQPRRARGRRAEPHSQAIRGSGRARTRCPEARQERY